MREWAESRKSNKRKESDSRLVGLDAFELVSLWRRFIIFSSHLKCVPLYAEIEFVINIHHQMRRAWKLGKDREEGTCASVSASIDNRPLRGNAFWLCRGAFWSSHHLLAPSGGSISNRLTDYISYFLIKEFSLYYFFHLIYYLLWDHFWANYTCFVTLYNTVLAQYFTVVFQSQYLYYIYNSEELFQREPYRILNHTTTI